MKLSELISYLEKQGISVDSQGSTDIEVNQVSGLDKAQANHISFLTDPKFASHLASSQAAAILIKQPYAEFSGAQLMVANPYYAYALVAQLFNPEPKIIPRVAKSAVVDSSAKLASCVEICANSVIEKDVEIGNHTVIESGAVIKQGVKIGENCRIGANVTIRHDCQLGDHVILEAGCVIGGDGFGWANNQGKWVKIPQIGRVIIGNHVSIGNNTTIDRGALDDTVIEDNCIIDNLVHIAHNVRIGSGSAIAGQAGFAGSMTLGQHCTVAGQVGFAGHLKVADNCHFMAKSGVTHEIKEAGAYAGFPAQNAKDWQKNTIRLRQLEKMSKQLKQLQRQVTELSEQQ